MFPQVLRRVVLSVLLVSLFSCGRPSSERESKGGPIPVRVRKAARIREPASTAVSGSVEPWETIDLAFQVALARAVYEKTMAGARAQELEIARVAFAHAEDEYRRMKQRPPRVALPTRRTRTNHQRTSGDQKRAQAI